jgi:hypothetical protein
MLVSRRLVSTMIPSMVKVVPLLVDQHVGMHLVTPMVGGMPHRNVVERMNQHHTFQSNDYHPVNPDLESYAVAVGIHNNQIKVAVYVSGWNSASRWNTHEILG